MTPRILTASLFATALTAAPLAAQEEPIVVPVEPATQGTTTGLGGFTATQGLAVAGAVVVLGIAIGSSGGDSSSGTD
jgi:hypothetical protein